MRLRHRRDSCVHYWTYIVNEDTFPAMLEPHDTPFTCANCGASYKVVRVEGATTLNELRCVRCNTALQACDDRFMLKYFLVGPNQPRHLHQPDRHMSGRQRPGHGRGRLRRI